MTKIIAVDFDGTLCENKYPEIGEPIQEVIDELHAEQMNGAKTILWTCRCDDELKAAVDWCNEHGIKFDAINEHLPEMKALFGNDTRKIFANEYWDDRAVRKGKSDNERTLEKT
jgi:2-hydroxy-3-keto-5-methylthiopentenyl-1-phosphate phosphatase